jgi:hypothetical protein
MVKGVHPTYPGKRGSIVLTLKDVEGGTEVMGEALGAGPGAQQLGSFLSALSHLY